MKEINKEKLLQSIEKISSAFADELIEMIENNIKKKAKEKLESESESESATE